MSLRKVIHVDMEAFYASVEQCDNPQPQGRPAAVGHDARHGVVATASCEARAFGVRLAMPSITAMPQCADLVVRAPVTSTAQSRGGSIASPPTTRR
jgi:DNA polymerase-4